MPSHFEAHPHFEFICCIRSPVPFLQIIDYNGGRELDDLIEFVEDQVSGKDEGEEDEDEEETPEPDIPKDEL